MKKKAAPLPRNTPLPRIRVGAMLAAIRGQLGLTYDRMGALAGVSPATLHNWTEGSPVEQVEAVLRLLARLPFTARHGIVDSACPSMPSLDHPAIAHNAMLAAYLRDIVESQRGATFVVGESEYLRTFVVTALAHSFAAQSPNRTIISGYDVHEPNWFLPVKGVTYLNVWKRRNGLEALFQGRRLEPAKMVFLNGVYSRMPAARPQTQSLSRKCHVLIAERSLAQGEMIHFGGPKHLVTVSVHQSAPSPDDLVRMQISVREP